MGARLCFHYDFYFCNKCSEYSPRDKVKVHGPFYWVKTCSAPFSLLWFPISYHATDTELNATQIGFHSWREYWFSWIPFFHDDIAFFDRHPVMQTKDYSFRPSLEPGSHMWLRPVLGYKAVSWGKLLGSSLKRWQLRMLSALCFWVCSCILLLGMRMLPS